MKSYIKQMKNGLLTNNPIFVQFLGMCPTLAVSTSVVNSLGMGLCVTAVLMCSNFIISSLRRFIPSQVRIASYIVIISGFVTAADLLMKAYLPELNKSLGLFIPLIVVNCLILARAESYASKNGPVPSVIDGISMGLGFTLALVIIGFIREILGTGVVFASADGTGGIRIPFVEPANIFIMAPGAFLTLAFVVAAFQKLKDLKHKSYYNKTVDPNEKNMAEIKPEEN